MLPDVTGTDLDDYYDALASSHEMRVRIEIWDGNDRLVEELSGNDVALTEGQVDVDGANAVSRQLSMTLANSSELVSDPTNPSSGINPQRTIRAVYSILVDHADGSSDWVDVPVFHGPVTRVKPNAMTVEVEAQSKEALLLPPARLNRSALPEDHGRVSSYFAGDLIRTIAERHGERMIRVPKTNRKLPEDAKVFDQASQAKGAWPLMKALAPKGMQLLYGGDGWLVLRDQRARQPVYVFRDGPTGTVLTRPIVEYDMKSFYNTLEYHAFEKKHGREKENPALRVVVRLPEYHPLSAQSLKRNGHPRDLLKIEKSKHVYANAAQAKADAQDILIRDAEGAMTVEFETLPIPHLEPGDLVAVDVSGLSRYTFELTSFSLPLTPAPMTLGYTRKIRSAA